MSKIAADPWHRTAGATAVVASIGNGAAFRKGRKFAAWSGLLPNQHSTVGKVRSYGISKRGNSYLRKILIHGARAVVLRSKRDRIAMGAWIDSLRRNAVPRSAYRPGPKLVKTPFFGSYLSHLSEMPTLRRSGKSPTGSQ